MTPRLPAVLASIGVMLWTPLHAGDEPPSLFVEGYTHQVSYTAGDAIQLHVSTSAPKFNVEIVRLGADETGVWKKNGIVGQAFPVPDNVSANGCGWPVSLEIPVSKDWRTGYYEVRLHVEDGGGKFVQRNRRSADGTCFFVLRPAEGAQRSAILLQLATNTYNAYNNWGGFSLYAYSGRGGNQGHRVSFDRPPASQFSRWERPFVAWAEREGIALDFAANSDLEFHPEVLKGCKLVLSVGHDEYWSAPMRDHLEKFIAEGGNVAFFSGNTCCWQVRSEDDGRALTCWKQNYHQDPVYPTGEHALLTSLWSHYLAKRPENQLTGVGFLWGGYRKSHGQFMDEPAEFTVHRPDHWALAGTNLKRGDVFGGKDTVVGYECDGCELEWREGLPFPTHRDGTPDDFEVLCTCPARWHPDDSEWYDKWERGRTGNAVLGVYTRGGTVFTTGTTDWAHGLQGGDAVVIRITRNVLQKLSR